MRDKNCIFQIQIWTVTAPCLKGIARYWILIFFFLPEYYWRLEAKNVDARAPARRNPPEGVRESAGRAG